MTDDPDNPPMKPGAKLEPWLPHFQRRVERFRAKKAAERANHVDDPDLTPFQNAILRAANEPGEPLPRGLSREQMIEYMLNCMRNSEQVTAGSDDNPPQEPGNRSKP